VGIMIGINLVIFVPSPDSPLVLLPHAATLPFANFDKIGFKKEKRGKENT